MGKASHLFKNCLSFGRSTFWLGTVVFTITGCNDVGFQITQGSKQQIEELCGVNATPSPTGPKITSPVRDRYVQPNITLEGTCDAGTDVLIQGGGINSPVTTSCVDGKFSHALTLLSPDGLKDLNATQPGIQGTSRHCIYLDTTPPPILITTPIIPYMNTIFLSVIGQCETGLDVTLSQSNGGRIVTKCENGRFQAQFPSTGGDGAKLITATQTDQAGNTGSDDQEYIVDTTVPLVKITKPDTNSTVKNKVDVTGTCETGLPVKLSGTAPLPAINTTCDNGQFSTSININPKEAVLYIVAEQTDLAGNRGWDQRNVIRDTTPPVLTLTSPAANTVARTGLTVGGGCTDGLPVEVAGTGVNAPVATTCNNGKWSADIAFSSGDGVKNVIATQTDLAGNIGSASRNFIRDNSAPVLTITAPAAGTATRSTIALTGTCETSLQVSLSGAITPTTAPCANGQFSATVTLNTPDGVKNVIASQTDGAGNTGSANRDFVLDTTAPQITITGPAAQTTAQTGVTLTGICTTGLPIAVSGAIASPSTATCDNGQFSIPVVFNNGDGNKNVVVSQTDSVGNIGSDNRSFVKDTTAPVITITAPAALTVAQSGITLEGACTDGLPIAISGAGVSAPTTATCTNSRYSTPVAFSAGDGNKNVVASQTDEAGNTGSVNRDFVRNNTPPDIKITAPQADTATQGQLVLLGTCKAGLMVEISGDITAGPINVQCNNGSFSANLMLPAPDGTKNVLAKQTDTAGNVGTDNRNFIRDTTAPRITITSPNAGTVAQTGVTVVGTCEAGLPVNLSGAGISAPITATCSNGQFSSPVTFSNGDGNKNVIASQTDAAGNTGSANRDFTKDTVGPDIKITAPAPMTVAQTGVTLVGSCTEGLPINISGTGVSAPFTATCASGQFSTPITFSAGDGTKNVVAAQTDQAGNTGSDNRDFEKDTTAPTIAITAPAAGTATRSQITLNGTCTTGLQVSLTGAITSPMTAACANGQFSATVTLASPDGSKLVTASQTDAVGNTGSASRSFTLSTAAPTITIASPAPNTVTRSAIALQGTCTNGLTVNISGDINTATTAACTNGQYSANVILRSGDGTKNISASQTDAIGNSGSANRNFILDTTSPLLTFTAPNAGTVAQSGVTVTGTCETGLQVALTGGITPTSTGCNNGQFSSPVTFTSGDGNKNVVASQTDQAGNTGSANRDFTKDTTGPNIQITAPASGTATRSQINVVGSCENGLVVNLGGAITAPLTTNCANGQFAATVALASPDGSKNVTASQTDAVGNIGTASRSFLLSTAAPNITITAPAPNSVTRSTIALQGACTNGLTINISGDVSAPTIANCANSQYSTTVTLSSGDGTKNVVVAQTDAIGNSGSANRNFILDTTAPVLTFTAPNAGTVARTGVTVTGTCETGLQVLLTGGITPTSTGCNNGQFSTPVTFSNGDGTKNVVASQTDQAGNTGSANRDFIKDTTPPTITIATPAAGTATRANIALTGACTDGLPINLTGDITPSMAVCLGGSWSAQVALLLPDGAKNVIASQTDQAGNIGSASRSFNLITTAPGIRITAPAPNTVTRGPLTVSGTCVSGLQIFLNGAITPTSTGCNNGQFSSPVTLTNGDGTKNVIASQTDQAGNTGSDNRDFILDTTAPLVRFTAPQAGTIVGTTVAVTGTCEAGLPVQLSGAGIGTPGPVSCAAGQFSATVTLSSGDGSKNIIASQTDQAGNSGSDNRSFNKDTTAPIIRIASPAANAITTGALTLTGSCETGLTVSISGTGLSGSPLTTTCSNSQFSRAITLSSPDGRKNISVAQTDQGGNTGSDNRDFILDTTAPRVTITSPTNGTKVSGAVVIQGTCEAGLALRMTGDITAANTSTCPSSGAFSVSVTVVAGNGSKKVQAEQTDQAGNIGSDSVNLVTEPKPNATETFLADAGEGKVDILFVDDNSVSMEEEQAALGSKFPSFVAELSGLDWQAGITTTDCSTGPWGICGSLLNMTGTSSYILTPNVTGFDQVFNMTIQRPETPGCAAKGQCPSGLEEAMKAAATAVDKRSTNNAGFFRNDAALAIVVLTDEDEQSDGTLPTATKPQAVVDKVTAAFGPNKKFKSYAITILPGDAACLKKQQDQQGGIGFYGTYAVELARLTGGQSVSICAPDYSVTLRQIGQDLRKLTQAVSLSRTPIPASVQVTFTPAQNITWTVDGNTILFNRAVAAGTKIDVYYEY